MIIAQAVRSGLSLDLCYTVANMIASDACTVSWILGTDEEFLATLAKNLEREGYTATVRSPAAGSLDSQDLGEVDVLMVDLASIWEKA